MNNNFDIREWFIKMNSNLPPEYLRRNYIQYPFVSYVSLIGTLFISEQYDATGTFILRAYTSLNELGIEKFEAQYLKETLKFIDEIKFSLISNNLLSKNILDRVQDLPNITL